MSQAEPQVSHLTNGARSTLNKVFSSQHDNSLSGPLIPGPIGSDAIFGCVLSMHVFEDEEYESFSKLGCITARQGAPAFKNVTAVRLSKALDSNVKIFDLHPPS